MLFVFMFTIQTLIIKFQLFELLYNLYIYIYIFNTDSLRCGSCIIGTPETKWSVICVQITGNWSYFFVTLFSLSHISFIFWLFLKKNYVVWDYMLFMCLSFFFFFFLILISLATSVIYVLIIHLSWYPFVLLLFFISFHRVLTIQHFMVAVS